MTARPIVDAIAIFIVAGVALFFFAALLAFVAHDSLGGADDAYNAHIAKNLAFGGSYGSTAVEGDRGTGGQTKLNGQGVFLFDPAITSGPILIVPAAFLMRVFGNEPWVPGLTTVLFAMVGCAGLFILHSRRERLWQVSLYLLVFGVVAYSITASTLWLWYWLLGEVPASLLAVLGISMVASGYRRTQYVGTVVMGLAVLTKLLAVLLCAPALIWITLDDWRNHGFRSAIGTAMRTAVLFLLPEGVFLLSQLLVLGWENFIQTQHAVIAFVHAHRGAINIVTTNRSSIPSQIVSRIAEHSAQFRDRTGISPLMLAACASLIAGAMILGGDAVNRRRALLLLSASALQFTWWLALSDGLPRYYAIGILTYAAGIATVVFLRNVKLGLGVAAFLLATHIASAKDPTTLVDVWWNGGFTESDRVRNLKEAVNVLKSLRAERPFVTGSNWPSMVAFEYLLPEIGNFVSYYDSPPEVTNQAFILAYDKTWLQWIFTPGFDELRQRCVTIFQGEPYYIQRCPPHATGRAGHGLPALAQPEM